MNKCLLCFFSCGLQNRSRSLKGPSINTQNCQLQVCIESSEQSFHFIYKSGFSNECRNLSNFLPDFTCFEKTLSISKFSVLQGKADSLYIMHLYINGLSWRLKVCTMVYIEFYSVCVLSAPCYSIVVSVINYCLRAARWTVK